MADTFNNAEAGSNGTAVTTGNSGGGGNTAFTGTSATGGSALTYDNTSPAHGSLCFKHQLVSGAFTTFYQYTITATGTLVLRVYVKCDTLPSAAIRLVDIRTGSATVVRLQTNAANKFEIQDVGGIQVTSALAFTANTYYRFEVKISTISATVGAYTASIFQGDSMTTFATFTTSTGNLGSTNITVINVGSTATSTSAIVVHTDDYAHSPTRSAFFGPVNNSATTSDTAGATDAVTTPAMNLHGVSTDTAGATDAVTRGVLLTSRTGSDTSGATDSAGRAFNAHRTTSDTAAATDAPTMLKSLHATAADTAVATDVATHTALHVARTAADTAAATESAARTIIGTRAPPDTAAATDVVTRGAFTTARVLSDTAAATDTATHTSLHVARSTSDTAAATDTATSGSVIATRSLADTAGATDAAPRAIATARAAVDTAGATDVATHTSLHAARSSSDTASATDAVTRGPLALSRSGADTAAATDAATRGTFILVRGSSDAAGTTDTATHTALHVGRAASDVAGATDAAIPAARGYARSASDTAGASDSASGGFALNHTPYRRFTAEGQPDGTHLTPSNSRTGSGDPITVGTRGAGANLNYSNNWSLDGAQAIRIDATSGTQTYFGWNDLNDMSLAYFLAIKFDIGKLPGIASFREVDFRNSVASAFHVSLTAANKIQLQDTNGIALGTAPLALLDGHAYVLAGALTISPTVAVVTFDYYDETDLTTSLWHFSTSAANTGSTPLIAAIAGACIATTWTGTQWVDSFAVRGGTTPVMPQPVAVNGVGTLATSSGGTIAVPYPASVAADDVLLMFLQSDAGASSYPTTPAGWTVATQEQAMPPSPGLVMLVSELRATGSESGTVAVTAGSDWAGVMVSVSNVRLAGSPWNNLQSDANPAAGISAFTTLTISVDESAPSGRRFVMAVAALSGVHATEALGGTLTNAATTEIFDSSGIVIVTAQGDGGNSADVAFSPATSNGMSYVLFDLVEGVLFTSPSDGAADAAPATDAATRSVASGRATPDTAGATDAATRPAQTRSRTGSDTAAGSESVTSTLGRFKTAADTAHATDTLTRGAKIAPRTAADTAPAIDTSAPLFPDVITIVDSIAITDLNLSQQIEYVIPTTESAAAVDSASQSFVPSLASQPRSAADSAPAFDAGTGARVGTPVARGAADSAPATDHATATFGRARVVLDAAQAVDVATFVFSAHLGASDSAPATDAATDAAVHPRLLSDSAGAAEDLSRSTGKLRVVGDTAPAVETLVSATRLVGNVIDTAHATDSAASAPGTHIGAFDTAHATESVASHEILGRTPADTAHATDAASGSNLQSLARSSSDSAPATDAATRPARAVSRTTSDSAPGVDTAAPLHTQAVTAADLAGATEDVERFALKQLQTSDIAGATDVLAIGSYRFVRQVADSAPAIDQRSDLLVVLLGTMTLAEPMYRFTLAERPFVMTLGER